MNYKFSVIIPSYNQAQYLPDAIDSVLAQTYQNFELIVIDDGSTDNSLQIAKTYPVKVISQVNKGLPSARNTGIMNSIGEYIFPLDADDMMVENCLEKVNQVIENTHADIIAPSLKVFGVGNATVILKSNPTLEDFTKANYIGYFSAIKKVRLLECGGYNPRMIWGWEDYDLWVDLLKRGASLVTIPEPLILYRTKEQSMIHEANKHAEELRKQMEFNHRDINWIMYQ